VSNGGIDVSTVFTLYTCRTSTSSTCRSDWPNFGFNSTPRVVHRNSKRVRRTQSRDCHSSEFLSRTSTVHLSPFKLKAIQHKSPSITELVADTQPLELRLHVP
jgi:hypothetical protein